MPITLIRRCRRRGMKGAKMMRWLLFAQRKLRRVTEINLSTDHVKMCEMATYCATIEYDLRLAYVITHNDI